jgi:hypothetical protein
MRSIWTIIGVADVARRSTGISRYSTCRRPRPRMTTLGKSWVRAPTATRIESTVGPSQLSAGKTRVEHRGISLEVVFAFRRNVHLVAKMIGVIVKVEAIFSVIGSGE